MKDGLKEIPIEERNPDEVKYISGKFKDEIIEVLIAPENSPAKNYGFDITPSRLVTGLITDKGIIAPKENEIKKLMVIRLIFFPPLIKSLSLLGGGGWGG